MLSVLLLRTFAFLAFAALVLWLVGKLWPKRAEVPLPLSTMTEQELRNAKAALEEKRKQLTNVKALATVNKSIAEVDHELAKLVRRRGAAE
jgi:predicted type IV restriction endonuclease